VSDLSLVSARRGRQECAEVHFLALVSFRVIDFKFDHDVQAAANGIAEEMSGFFQRLMNRVVIANFTLLRDECFQEGLFCPRDIRVAANVVEIMRKDYRWRGLLAHERGAGS